LATWLTLLLSMNDGPVSTVWPPPRCGQISVGPCSERLTQPQIEFVLAQPSLHERHLEQADHLHAVSVTPAGAHGPP